MEQDFYFISTAARLLGMHPQTLRKYERLGLIQPSRTLGSMRLYSREELERLKLIKHLVDVRESTWRECNGCCRLPTSSNGCAALVRDDSLSARDTRRRVGQELDALNRVLGFD